MSDRCVQVAVLVCCYNGRADLPALLASLTDDDEPGIDTRVVVVDNGSTDGSGDYVRTHFPQVECIRIEPNRGFTGGNNFGHAHVRKRYPDARYLVLLNSDTVVEPGWLRPLVDAMDGDPHLAAAQPTLLLHPDTHRINTTGNRSHYLGFGMMMDYGEPRTAAGDAPRDIDFPSGAAVMLRLDPLAELGLFDEAFYMYLEDADLGWKLRQAGHAVRFVPESVVQHKYAPDAPSRYYRHLERNRWLLLLTYYRWRTLALLAPPLFAMEVGQCLYAASQGALGQKLASWLDVLRPGMIRTLRERRRAARKRRRLTDRAFMGAFAGRVNLPAGDPWLLRCVGNPMLDAYWRVVRRMIRW